MPEHVEGASPISAPVLLLEWWKPAVGFEGSYEITNCGRVARLSAPNPLRPLKWIRHSAGYPELMPCINGKPQKKLVHHLVAETFIGPRPCGLIVNHIDGWKWNPRLSNLEYITPRGNYDHAVSTGLVAHGVRCNQAKLDDDKVSVIKRQRGLMTAQAIAEKYDVTDSAIYRIWHGKSWKHVY